MSNFFKTLKYFIICFWQTFFIPVLKRVDEMFLDKNANYNQWSSAKLGVFFCLYPAVTFAYLFDVIHNGEFDWLKTAVFAVAVAAPRTLSQLLSSRMGAQNVPSEEESLQVPRIVVKSVKNIKPS